MPLPYRTSLPYVAACLGYRVVLPGLRRPPAFSSPLFPLGCPKCQRQRHATALQRHALKCNTTHLGGISGNAPAGQTPSRCCRRPSPTSKRRNPASPKLNLTGPASCRARRTSPRCCVRLLPRCPPWTPTSCWAGTCSAARWATWRSAARRWGWRLPCCGQRGAHRRRPASRSGRWGAWRLTRGKADAECGTGGVRLGRCGTGVRVDAVHVSGRVRYTCQTGAVPYDCQGGAGQERQVGGGGMGTREENRGWGSAGWLAYGAGRGT